MYLVGLTGGIASGKSLVSAHFEKHGIVVVDADIIAHQVVEPGSEGLKAVIDRFGKSFLRSDGMLDRQALRQHVFEKSNRREELEAILHPRIRERMFTEAANANSPYVILSVPLLVEGGLHRLVDRVLVVDVEEDIQRQRLAARDGSSRAQMDAIMRSQCSRQARLDVADDVIDNNGTKEDIPPQVEAIHHKYLNLASEHQKR